MQYNTVKYKQYKPYCTTKYNGNKCSFIIQREKEKYTVRRTK